MPTVFRLRLLALFFLLPAAVGAAEVPPPAPAIPGCDPAAPVFIAAADRRAAAHAPAVLPPVAQAGEFPRLLFTPGELAAFRTSLEQSAEGRAALDRLRAKAMGDATPLTFPSVEDTVANRADKAHSALAQRAQALALLYALNGDRAAARGARAILLGYAERYASYPRHGGRNKSDSSKIYFQRLSEAMWLISLLEACDYLYAGDVLSAEDRRVIETQLIRPSLLEIHRTPVATEIAKRTRKHADWRTATPPPAVHGNYPNWLNFYSTATLMAGALLDDRDLMDLAAADFRTAIATGIGADGMWGEGAIGYQFFAMEVMVTGFEVAARQGIDLWNLLDGRFKQLFDTPLYYAYPDSTLPGINDSTRATFGTWQTMVYDYGYLRYHDPAYAGVINQSPRQLFNSEGIYLPTQVYTPLAAAAPGAVGSTLFSSLGYAILRDDTKYALLDYGPHGGRHGHFDKLNLILFANAAGEHGDEMGGEPVFHSYNDPLHAEWTKESIAHNTVTLDGASQAATEGKLLVFADTPAFKVMRGESLGAYPGAWLDRTVAVTPDLVIDVFLGRSAGEHTWDRTFRFAGKLDALTSVSGTAAPLGTQAGYQHLQGYPPQPATDRWTGRWDTKAGEFEVRLAGTPAQELILARGPDDDDFAIARQHGTQARFGAVYRLGAWPRAIQSVRWLTAEADLGPAALEVVASGGTYRVIVARAAGEWSAAGWTSDARVLCVRESGDPAKPDGLLAGGTFAKSEQFELRQPKPGIYPLR